MKVQLRKSFERDYEKLKPAQRERLDQALTLFLADPMHRDLYNHPLAGQWVGYRSIAFGGDWRAHYKVVGDEAIFVACGTHNQLYR